MKTIFYILLIALVINTSCDQERGRIINERTEWSHSWMVSTSDTVLPRILIIGDSHVENYYQHIVKSLKERANVCKYTTSKSLGDPILIDQLKLILKQYSFDLITFNNGLHGRKYEEHEYEKSLEEVINLFFEYSEGEIVLVNTTPARDRTDLELFQDFNKKIEVRNEFFSSMAKRENLKLIDLYSLGMENIEYYRRDGIHFTQEGVEAEARIISDKLLVLLDKPKE